LLPRSGSPRVPRPIADRLPVTPIPVLAGFVPGVTVTVRVIESPMLTVLGLAVIVPDGFVLPCIAVHAELAFCGLLVALIWKSFALLSVSVPLPAAPPGLRS